MGAACSPGALTTGAASASSLPEALGPVAVVLALFWGLMAAACVFDLRERVLPNGLAAALAVAACFVVALAGTATPARFGWALAFAGVLLVSAVLYRLVSGTAGLGMGDVKFAAPLALVYPAAGPAAFALGLVALALTGIISRQRTLPCIPFIVGALAVLCLVRL